MNSDNKAETTDITENDRCYRCLSYDSDRSYCNEHQHPMKPFGHCSLFSENPDPILAHEVDENTKHKISQVRDLQTAFEQGIPPLKWIVQDIVPENGLTIIGGRPGSYKSFISQDMALKVVTGQLFLERFETTPCNVLYLDEENGDATLLTRFENLLAGDDPPSNLYVASYLNVMLDDLTSDLLLALISAFHIKLVIVDSLVRCMRGDENKAEDVRKIFQNIKEVQTKIDVAFLLLHHNTKSNAGDMNALRGSGDLAAQASVIMLCEEKLSPERALFRFTMAKNRHIERTKYANLIVAVNNVNENVIFNAVEESDTTQADDCTEFIRDWLRTEQPINWASTELKKLCQTEKFTQWAYYAAIKALQDGGEITKLKRRGWYARTTPDIVDI